MSKVLFTSAMLLAATALSTAAFAESPVCAASQDGSWMQPEAVQEQVQSLGYTIETMSISEGNCYELTGLNSDGQSITAYLDPVSGSVVQEDVVQ